MSGGDGAGGMSTKVLFYDQFRMEYGGGGEVWLANVAQRLTRRGLTVRVATASNAGSGARATVADLLGEPPAFRITRLRSITLPLGLPLILPGQLPLLLQLIREADVIYYVHGSPVFELPLLLWAKKLLRKPIIAAYEGPLRPHKVLLRMVRQLTARLLILLDILDGHHVLNQADAELLKRLGGGDVRVIPNGTDLPEPTGVLTEGPAETFRVLFVGHLGPQKGFDLFLALVDRLNAQVGSDRIHFTVIGSGPMEAELQSRVREHGNLVHLPYVPHRDMADHYANAHLLLAPYRYEGQPLAVVEAQAAGLPVVATRLPGIQEAIQDGETGALLPPEDIEGLADGVLGYLATWQRDPDQYQAITAGARRHAQQFGWPAVTERIAEFIDSIRAKSVSP